MMIRTLKALLLASLLLAGLAPRLYAAAPALAWQSPPQSSAPTSANLHGVACGNGLCVAVGDGGTVLLSTDGTHWEQERTPTALALYGVTYGDGQFVAVGGVLNVDGPPSAGVVLTSADGKTWSAYNTVTQNRGPLRAVTYANGRFVAVGNDLDAVSNDGQSWTDRAGPGDDLTSVAFGNGEYVATGGEALYTSTDGLIWTKVSQASAGRSVTFGNGQFVALDNANEGLLTSTDGLSWNHIPAPVSGIDHLAYGAGRFLGVGHTNSSGAAAIATSTDGADWTQIPANTLAALGGVVYGAGGFVAVGDRGTILNLDDTGNWTERPLQGEETLVSIAYGSGRFVAVGWGGALVTSEDGFTWTQRNSHTGTALERVRYGNGRFVAIGQDGTILTSVDGTDWQIATQWKGALSGLTFGNGLFVAVGWPGVVITSPDGITWTAGASGTQNAVKDVAYAQGRFYAYVSVDQSLITSTDGTNWTKAAASPSDDIVRLIAFGGRLFARLGTTGVLASDNLTTPILKGAPWMWKVSDFAEGGGWQVTAGWDGAYASSDGITWTPPSGPESNYMQAVAYGDGRFVGVGQDLIRVARVTVNNAPPALPLPDQVKLSYPTVAPPPGFTDVAPQHWAFQAIGAAVNAKLIFGYPEGVFMPDAPIRRSEFLAIIMRAYPQPDLAGQPFDDVPPSHWAYSLILQARAAGLVQGDGNQFRPNDYISRAEMAVILQRALKLPLPTQSHVFPDMDEQWSWAADSVQALGAYGLIQGLPDGSFGPDRQATRASVAMVLTRLFAQ